MLPATVVIPTYNRPRALQYTLRSLNAQCCTDDFEVIVVDDGSTTNTAAVLDFDWRFPLRHFWQRHEGFGAGRARNTGILFARGRIIVLLDDDMVVPPELIGAHIDLHSDRDDTVAIGLRHRVPHRVWSPTGSDAKTWQDSALADARANIAGESQWRREPWTFFATCNASVSRSALVDAGLFDESFTHWSFEDTELAWRLRQVGVSFRLLTERACYHLESADCDMTLARSLYHLSPAKWTSYQRNCQYFAEKYPEETELQRILERELQFRRVANDPPPPDVAGDSQSPTRGERAADGVHRLALSIVPAHMSLLTPYSEDDEGKPNSTLRVAAETNHPSLLEDLRRDFGFDGVGGRFNSAVIAEVAWTILLTPLLAVSCLAIFVVLVATGRYRRIFRRSNA